MNKIILAFYSVFLSIVMKPQASSFQWAGNLGGGSQEYMYFASTIDQLSNVYTAGTFLGPGDFDPGVGTYSLNNKGADGFISKLDASGNFVWAKNLETNYGCEPWAITCDTSNNVLVTGNFYDSLDLDPGIGNYYLKSGLNNDAFILKLDPAGNFMWGGSFTGPGSYISYASDIGSDGIGNTITTGTFGGIVDFNPGSGTFTLSSISGGDPYIVKLDPSGNFIWAKQFSAWTNVASIRSLDVDASNNIIVSGDFLNIVDFDPSPTTYTLNSSAGNMYVAALDPNGNLIWVKQMGGGVINPWDIKFSSSGDIYVGGDFSSVIDLDPSPSAVTYTSSGIDYFIVKLDPMGNYIWSRTSGNGNDEVIYSLDVDGIGNVYMTGFFEGISDFDPGPGTYTLASTFGGENIYNLKLDPSGNFSWANHFGGSTWSWGMGICVDAPGNVFTIGYFNGTPDFDPSPLTQYNISAYGFEDIFVQKMGQASTNIIENVIGKNTCLFPNPNNGLFNFQTDNNGNLNIFDITGQIILNEKIDRGITKINTGSLSKGIYLYSFSSENGHQQKGKLIID